MRSEMDVVRRIYRALADGDVPALLELSDPEIEIEQSGLLPYGGQHVGHTGLGVFLQGVRETFESDIEVVELFAAGDRVVQVGRTRGRAVRTGRTFTASEVQIWRIRDGRATALQIFADTDVLLEALEP